jgi:UDP-N-acetylmuramoylalanine--D-glutamate ligase
MSRAFEGERAVVIGAGVAGASAARVLAAEGASVRVTEDRPGLPAAVELRRDGFEVLEGHAPEHLEGTTLVVASPGVRPDAPVLRWAGERGVPTWGEMELGARLARVPYLAVTGTNGKTTTTGMLAACLRASGLDAVGCGNIGHPFPAAAREDHDALVVEVSSFQLAMQESFHPRVSVLLNLSPDHLDWHGSFGAYGGAKARIFERQHGDDVHVGNRDDGSASALSAQAPCEVRWFTLGEPKGDEAGIDDGRVVAGWSGATLWTTPDGAPALGIDAAACAAVAHAFAVPDVAIAEGLAAFVPHPHRGEVVAVVQGIRFVDNSKATNPHATIAAVGDTDGVVLIAGGDAKGVDLSPIATLAPRLAGVVTLGASRETVRSLFDGSVPVAVVASIEEAVSSAFTLAREGGTVLLAPACASWDMFRDYAERGDRFAAASRALTREEARR